MLNRTDGIMVVLIAEVADDKNQSSPEQTFAIPVGCVAENTSCKLS